MSKIVIAISASVTAFILALTAAAVYAYRGMSGSTVTVQQPQPVSQTGGAVGTSLMLSAAPAAVAMPSVSPQDAASVAAKAINRTDLYSIELADYQGAQAYKVTFSSGDIVYISMTGQFLGSEMPPAPVYVTQSGGGSGGNQGGSGGSYEQHDDYEHEGGEGD